MTVTGTDLVDKAADSVGILWPKHVPDDGNGPVASLDRYSFTTGRVERCRNCQHTPAVER